MEVADAMASMKEDAVGVGTVVAGWEDEDDETRIEDYVGQQELGASVDNGRWLCGHLHETIAIKGVWISASTMTLWHHFHSTSEPEFPNLGLAWPV
jgi:hypothetical protein